MAGKKTETQSPWNGEDSPVTVTLKAGKGYDDPWIVVKGSVHEVHERLLELMGWDASKVDELPLASTVLAASDTWHAQANVSSGLGGRFLSESTGEPVDYGSRVEDVQAEAGVPAEIIGNDAAITVWQAMESATTEEQMKQLWKDRRLTFQNTPELVPLWQERAKAIKESGKPTGLFGN